MPEKCERHRFMKRDIDEELVWALHCENPSLERVRELVAAGADVNARDAEANDEDTGTVLMHAVFDRRVPKEIVRFLIEQGADVNGVNHTGDSVLMRALWNRNLEPGTVEMLLSRGVDIDLPNNEGLTPLLSAVSSPFPQEKIGAIIRLLVEAGANPNATDSLGDTVIMRALANVPKLPLSVVDYLGGCGAVIDYLDEDLLATAVVRFQPEAVAYLLDNGANPNRILDEPETALDWVEDLTQVRLEAQWAEESLGAARREEVERLSAIYKLLLQSGAKHGKEIASL